MASSSLVRRKLTDPVTFGFARTGRVYLPAVSVSALCSYTRCWRFVALQQRRPGCRLATFRNRSSLAFQHALHLRSLLAQGCSASRLTAVVTLCRTLYTLPVALSSPRLHPVGCSDHCRFGCLSMRVSYLLPCALPDSATPCQSNGCHLTPGYLNPS